MSNSWLLFSFISISHSVTKCVCSIDNIDLSSITKASVYIIIHGKISLDFIASVTGFVHGFIPLSHGSVPHTMSSFRSAALF